MAHPIDIIPTVDSICEVSIQKPLITDDVNGIAIATYQFGVAWIPAIWGASYLCRYIARQDPKVIGTYIWVLNVSI